MSIAFSGIVAFFFRGLNLIIALGMMVITSNELGTDGRGTFTLGAIAIGLVASFTGGLTAATAYQVSNQKRDRGLVLLNGSALSVALGAIAIVAGIMVRSFATGEASVIALSVSAAACAIILLSVVAGVFLGSNAMIRYNVVLVLPPFLALAGIAVTIFVLDHRTPEASLTAFAVGQWAALVVLLAAGPLRMVRGIRFEGSLAAAILSFTLLGGISSAVSYLNYRADAFLVQAFEGAHGVAIYGNAVFITEAVWQFSGSLALASYPRLGGATEAEAVDLTARIMRHTIVILAVVCGALFLLADLIVAVLLDPEYESVATVLRILLPGTLLYGLAASFSGFYTYQRGKPWAAAVVAGAGLAIDIVLAFVLLPLMGVNGAALASSIAYGTAIVGAVFVFLRATHSSPTKVLRFSRQDLDDYRDLAGRLRGVLARTAVPTETPTPPSR